MFPSDIHDLARKIIEIYTAQKRKIVTAKSCTGGLLTAALTQISGASAVIERGFVTYSNDAKVETLGVLPELIEVHGAVDDKVAEAMAQGALEFSRADIAISVTGIAGPTGGTPAKPVGLVYFGIANRTGATFHYKAKYNGDRDDIRMQAVHEALRLLHSMASE